MQVIQLYFVIIGIISISTSRIFEPYSIWRDRRNLRFQISEHYRIYVAVLWQFSVAFCGSFRSLSAAERALPPFFVLLPDFETNFPPFLFENQGFAWFSVFFFCFSNKKVWKTFIFCLKIRDLPPFFVWKSGFCFSFLFEIFCLRSGCCFSFSRS